ncbi:MAG: S1/P1 nuclease [Bryobacterales bacterium]|nr:S1/P1 nuclease [Bryobacterales bacterium]MDE0625669.1 S1/P1 nuclease [Bryobacterales bacterium]
MEFRSPRRWTLLLAGWLASGCALYGWSQEGHRIAARVAQEELSERSRQRMAYLVGKDVSLQDVSTWADEIVQERPETEAWHSITIPPGARGIDFRRDCPLGDCITVKMRDCIGIVRLGIQSREQILDAFRMLVSLVADMHHPMLNGYPPSHANDHRIVDLDGVEMSLFDLWESGLIDHLGSEEEVLERVRKAVASEEARTWTAGTYRSWTWETHLIARDHIYPAVSDGPGKTVLRGTALDKASKILVDQLAKSAVRLAYVLDVIWP